MRFAIDDVAEIGASAVEVNIAARPSGPAAPPEPEIALLSNTEIPLSEPQPRTDVPAVEVTRRAFLAGGGVVLLGMMAPGLARAAPAARLNAWVAVGPGEQITLALMHAEMGQGITTTLPAILADELEVDFTKVRLVPGDFDPAFRHPLYYWQFTGNSESIATYAEVVRAAGAAAREMLIGAAAQRLGVPASALSAKNGVVLGGGKPLSYGELAGDAARIPPPTQPVLKPASDRRSLSFPRVDIPEKVDGSAVFGIDVKVPGMLLAAVRFAPQIGGKLEQLDEAALLARRGVKKVVRLDKGYAVVADRWWRANSALDAGAPVWSGGSDKDTAGLLGGYRVVMKAGPFKTVKSAGSAPARGGKIVSGEYLSPFQAHATMEPMNCTVRLTEGRCEIWAPTQGMEMTHLVAKQVTGLPDDAIVVNRTYMGGGFGRRLLGDFVKVAIEVARAANAPVKTIWSREADFAADAFRPAMLHRIEAVLGEDGLPAAMAHKVVSPSMLRYGWPRGMFPNLADATQPIDPPAEMDLMPVEGVMEPIYAIPHYVVDFHRYTPELPVSVWRTTGHGPNNWALESIVDDCAHVAGVNPVAYRRRLLAGNPRMLRLLDALVEKAGLASPPPEGEARGIALAHGFGSMIAQSVTLSLADKAIRFRRVVSIVDLGEVLDAAIATRNVEGGVIWGLSALRTDVPFAAGGPAVSNFDGFDPLHLSESPAIETHFIDGGGKPGGIGEVGPVPTLAAVCNAIFAATGTRIRELPLSKAGFTIA